MTEIKQHTMQDSHSNQTTNSTTHSALGQSASEAVASPKSKGFLRNLFDDLSIAQVIAGALAAATVFLLSSVIGVAGSLIGAAIGSVISAVSSQVYKKALSASADKLRDASSTTLLSGESAEYLENTKGVGGESADLSSKEASSLEVGNQAEQSDSGSSKDHIHESETTTCKVAMSDATRVMNANDIRYRVSHGKGEDPALRRAHERRGRKAKIQRQVLVVSVVSSLIAIVVCAAVISFATQGQGIGTKTDPILPAITNQAHSVHTGATSNSASDQNTEDNASSDNASTEGGTTEGSGTTNNQNSSQGSNSSGDTGSSGNSGGSDSANNSGSSSGSGNTTDGSAGDGSGTDSGSPNSGAGSGSNSNGSGNSDSFAGSGASTNG